MKTIAFINQKGGTGKTISAATFGRILAKDYGRRVLLSDTDPSWNLTQYMGMAPDASGMEHLLRFGYRSWARYIKPTEEAGIDMIPGSTGLGDADIHSDRFCSTALVDHTLALEEEDAYDFQLIDCHPYLGVLSMAALMAADEVIIPVNLESFSLSGMAELTMQISRLREMNHEIRIAGVLPTRYMRTKEEQENHEMLLRDAPFPVFETRIRASGPVITSVGQQKSLLEVSRNCGAAVDYRAAVAEYLKGVGVQL